MKRYNQFILCDSQKRPISPHDYQSIVDPLDPKNWMPADVAYNTSALLGLHVGFVFTVNDPFFFLDIDKCLGADGQWSEMAHTLCRMFPLSYKEISQSGQGLHIFGSGVFPEHSCKNTKLGIEFYTQDRYVMLTGTGATGDPNAVEQDSINHLVETYFPPVADVISSEWTTGPCLEWKGEIDDEALIMKMVTSGQNLADLWNNNVDALAQRYPHDSKPYDASSADAALCSHLAFWTGKDCERMKRLMWQSRLVRDKWTKHKSYLQRTILNAIGKCGKVCGESVVSGVEPVSVGVTVEPGAFREGFQYLTLDGQIELFKGCVYVIDLHRVLTPDGSLLGPEQFKVVYGGYVFGVDSINDRTTRSAWEAFTENQGLMFPKVNSICFRPEIPQGAIVREEDKTIVNIYVPIRTRARSGDVMPLLMHLAKLFPDKRDREIILSYLAAIVQYPGIKFQWAVMIQGCEGNGKSFIGTAITHCVGHRYTHLPNASDLGGNGLKFNNWISGKLLIIIEEIYVSDRKEISDALKPIITNLRIELQRKGGDQITGDNRANFIIFTNYKDAILKNKNDRRYCVFFTAHQSVDDLVRDGMFGNSYFPDLYEWGRSGGYEIINHYLMNYKIKDEFNPATLCTRSPETSSTSEAIGLSLGGIEQEIVEAIGEGREGFSGGWISSMALNRLLESRRDTKRMPINRRKKMLDDLGYEYHPGLKEGRVNSIIPAENGKPRLYIKKGHILGNLKHQSDIIRHYLEAQGYAAVGSAATQSVGG